MFDVVRSPILLCHDTLTQQCNQTREGKVDGWGSKAQQAERIWEKLDQNLYKEPPTAKSNDKIVRKMATTQKIPPCTEGKRTQKEQGRGGDEKHNGRQIMHCDLLL